MFHGMRLLLNNYYKSGWLLIKVWENVLISKLKDVIIFNDSNDPVQSFYLYGFSDLSLLAYGACVYLKAVTKSSNIYVSLVASNSRLVPATKKFTIPK